MNRNKGAKGKALAVTLIMGMMLVATTTVLIKDKEKIKKVDLSTVKIFNEENPSKISDDEENTKVEEEESTKENVKLLVNADYLTVANSYDTYNQEKQVHETHFSDPLAMKKTDSVDFVLSAVNGMEFSLSDKDEDLSTGELTYDMIFYKEDKPIGNMKFYGLDTIVWVEGENQYVSKLDAKNSEDKIMELVTFFKPVHF